jgi:pimeloyl-ACP methyl ester carboxylesterase
LHASAHPVDALVLMAPAVDYAQRLQTRSAADFERWRTTGVVEVDHYGTGRRERLSFDLIRDAANHEPFPSVAAPTLVLQGASDEIVPLPLVRSWVRQQPRATLVVYDSGHELTAVVDAMWSETIRFLRDAGVLPVR